MRVLRIRFRFIISRRRGNEFLSVKRRDLLPCKDLDVVRNTERIGSHICDHTGKPLAGKVDTFKQALRNGHGLRRTHIESRGGILLQRAGRKRRFRSLDLFLFSDVRNNKIGAFQTVEDPVKFLAASDLLGFSL